MKTRFIIITVLLLSLIPVSIYAQDKTQAYYAQHERELLPDAQAEFKNGNYQRAVVLCQWHYIMIGDDAANTLREKAEKCQSLVEDMNRLSEDKNDEAAMEKALALLALNPEDKAAKELLLAAEIVVSQPIEEKEVVNSRPVLIEDSPTSVTEPLDVKDIGPTTIVNQEPPKSILQTDVQPVNINNTSSRKTKFGIKAEVSILDSGNASQSIAYGGAFVAYDIKGSRLGGELGVLFTPSLKNLASFAEVDASVIVRAFDWLYPKASVGYYSCKYITGNSPSDTGLVIGTGLSFRIGHHFSVDIGAMLYDAISIKRIDIGYNNQGEEYPMTYDYRVIQNGIKPTISIGYTF